MPEGSEDVRKELKEIKEILGRSGSVLEKIERNLAQQSEGVTESPQAFRRRRILRGVVVGEKEELHWPLEEGLKTLRSFKGESVTADDVAKAMGVARSRASEILNDLFRTGYVEKIRDKRLIRFRATSKKPQKTGKNQLR